ncbi:gustatory receptor for bitter taste 66a-like [Planococcus citri]|uniref:gustatory receptor for bitter taste 66a-like n=1 Tax=Planococcus citri TaxID=170843 RepID=UPI0031F9C72D
MLRYSARLISWFDVFYFLAVLKIIRLHFERINTEMIVLKRFQNHLRSDNYLKIVKLNKMHKSLRNICKIHNESYSIQLLWLTYYIMSMTTVLVYLIIFASVIYFVLKNDVPIMAGYVYYGSWVVLYYSFCYFVLRSVTGVAKEGNNTVELIQKLQLEVDQQYLNKFLKIFSRQIYDDKIEFSACGFFPLDFTLIYQVISSSSMYLIILLQFHFSKLHVKIINN